MFAFFNIFKKSIIDRAIKNGIASTRSAAFFYAEKYKKEKLTRDITTFSMQGMVLY